ncbi:ABC transporter permease [Ammonicoccus fulvus]|uniref:ABC transporter permease n=1 Tax=Ammonicoccus fulvus TaxID=3138240 RepID=A0ABZ3FSM1_9ACTN
MSAVRAWRLFASELGLMAGRRRNQVGVGVLMAIPVLMAMAIRLSRPGGPHGPDFITEVSENGFFVALSALSVMIPLFLPLAVAALCGDAIAGEANQGTLRYLLTVPVHRTRLLLTKYAALVVGAFIAPTVVALAGLLSGWILFGLKDVRVLSGTEIPLVEGLGRLVLFVAYLAVCLAALAAVGLFISTLTEQPIAAMLATAGVVMISWILSGIPQLDWLHPWLITAHWAAGTDLFRDPIFFDSIRRGLLLALAYILVFVAAAWARFGSKDITS